MDKTVRCPSCLAQFKESQILDLKACPTCNSTQMPQIVEHDVTLTLNWDELRLLANWSAEYVADNFAQNSEILSELKVLLNKVGRHRPPGADPLTLEEAVAELEREGFFEAPPEIAGKQKQKFLN
jgi:hypothetical protein